MINFETLINILFAIFIFYFSSLFPILTVYKKDIKNSKKMIIILTIIFLVLLISVFVLYLVVSPDQLFKIVDNYIMFILEFTSTKQELINREDYIIIFFSVIIAVPLFVFMTLNDYFKQSYKILDKILIAVILLCHCFNTLMCVQYLIELVFNICFDNFVLTLIITLVINYVILITLDKIILKVFDLEYD
jgi:hypothetical protein